MIAFLNGLVKINKLIKIIVIIYINITNLQIKEFLNARFQNGVLDYNTVKCITFYILMILVYLKMIKV